MSVIATQRPWRDQASINRRVWSRLVADPRYAEIPERVETDREGRAIMSPPPSHRHSRRQFRIGSLLEALLPGGFVLTECAVSTAEGVRPRTLPGITLQEPRRRTLPNFLTEPRTFASRSFLLRTRRAKFRQRRRCISRLGPRKSGSAAWTGGYRSCGPMVPSTVHGYAQTFPLH